MRTQITRRTRLLGGAALGAVAALTFTGTASAQDAPQDTPQETATQVEEVIVTGIRGSIESSIASKRENSSIVEVVTAEDIGKLPDVSIAESLARLPGLTAQRLDGRGQVISIRGLAPDFTTALLNGREQVSAGDNRGVEFDQYPSELLGSVLVYKTPDAALIGQGLAGTADLRTIRPLEYGRQAIALNARYEWNDYGALNSGTEDTGQRFSVSYIDQFMDDTLGVVLGYAHMSTPYQAERFNAWGYPNSGPGGELLIGGAKPYVQSSELVRDGSSEGEAGDEGGAPEKTGTASHMGSHLILPKAVAFLSKRPVSSQSYANFWKLCKRHRDDRCPSVAKMRRTCHRYCAAQR